MRKIPTGNPTCPPFVQHAKKIFNALVDKCNISSHEHICNLANNNAMLDAVEKTTVIKEMRKSRRMQKLLWNQPK